MDVGIKLEKQEDGDTEVDRYYKHYTPWYNIFQEYSTLLNVTIPSVFEGALLKLGPDISFMLSNIRYVYVYDGFEEYINAHRNINDTYTVEIRCKIKMYAKNNVVEVYDNALLLLFPLLIGYKYWKIPRYEYSAALKSIIGLFYINGSLRSCRFSDSNITNKYLLYAGYNKKDRSINLSTSSNKGDKECKLHYYTKINDIIVEYSIQYDYQIFIHLYNTRKMSTVNETLQRTNFTYTPYINTKERYLFECVMLCVYEKRHQCSELMLEYDSIIQFLRDVTYTRTKADNKEYTRLFEKILERLVNTRNNDPEKKDEEEEGTSIETMRAKLKSCSMYRKSLATNHVELRQSILSFLRNIYFNNVEERDHVGNKCYVSCNRVFEKIYRTCLDSVSNILGKSNITDCKGIESRIHVFLQKHTNNAFRRNIFYGYHKEIQLFEFAKISNTIYHYDDLNKVYTATKCNRNNNCKLRLYNYSHCGIYCPYNTPDNTNTGLHKVFAKHTVLTPTIEDATKLREYMYLALHYIQEYILPMGRLYVFETNNRNHALWELNPVYCGIYYNDVCIAYATTNVPNDIGRRNLRIVLKTFVYNKMSVWFRGDNTIHLSTIPNRAMFPIRLGRGNNIPGAKYIFVDVMELYDIGRIECEDDDNDDDGDADRIFDKAGYGSYSLSVIPSVHKCPGVRNLYVCGFIKHCYGPFYKTNMYIQKTYGYFPANENDVGCNLYTLYMCYDNENQHDSIVINDKYCVDSGSMTKLDIHCIHRYHVEYNGDMYASTNIDYALHNIDSDIYNADGVIRKYSRVSNGTCLVLKINTNGNSVGLLFWDKIYEGIVIDSITTTTKNNDIQINIYVKTTHKVNVGDKLASVCGQKGVISKIVNEHDLPYYYNNNNSNICFPDIIVNPLGIISRGTMNQLDNARKVVIYRYVKGIGEVQIGECYISYTRYMRLGQLSINKVHGRLYGPIDIMTHLPQSGIRCNGGIRLGKQEIDCLMANNAYGVIDNIYKENTYSVKYCNQCHYIQHTALNTCVSCNADLNIKYIKYCAKYLFDYLQCLYVKPVLQ